MFTRVYNKTAVDSYIGSSARTILETEHGQLLLFAAEALVNGKTISNEGV